MAKLTYYDSSLLKSNTTNGGDWLRKYVHPPSAKGTSYNGYPDRSTVPVAHVEYRLNEESLDPAIGPESTPTCMYLMAPALHYPMFKFRVLDGTSNPALVSVMPNDQISNDTIVDLVGKQRMAYASATFQYDCTAFNNSGMVYSAQFSPTIEKITVGSWAFRVYLENNPKKYEEVLGHINKRFGFDVAKIVSNYVNVNCKQQIIDYKEPAFINAIAKSRRDTDYDDLSEDKVTPYGVLGLTIVQIVKLGYYPTRPTDLTMLSPKSYAARAVDGAFVVQQCNQDSNQFKGVFNTFFKDSKAVNKFPYLCLYQWTNGVDDIIDSFTTPTKDYLYDAEWSDWTWSYVGFFGTNPGSSPLNINIKYLSGFELTPMPRSLLNSFVTPPALYDPEALLSASIITQSRQDAMAAIYNSLGGENALAKVVTDSDSGAANMMEAMNLGPKESKKLEKEMLETTTSIEGRPGELGQSGIKDITTDIKKPKVHIAGVHHKPATKEVKRKPQSKPRTINKTKTSRALNIRPAPGVTREIKIKDKRKKKNNK